MAPDIARFDVPNCGPLPSLEYRYIIVDSHWTAFYTNNLAPHATNPDHEITYEGEECRADHLPNTRLATTTVWWWPHPLIFYIESKTRTASFFTDDMDDEEDEPNNDDEVNPNDDEFSDDKDMSDIDDASSNDESDSDNDETYPEYQPSLDGVSDEQPLPDSQPPSSHPSPLSSRRFALWARAATLLQRHRHDPSPRSRRL